MWVKYFQKFRTYTESKKMRFFGDPSTITHEGNKSTARRFPSSNTRQTLQNEY